MNEQQNIQIENTLHQLFKSSKNDYLRIMGVATKRIFRPMGPHDFKEMYLSISQEQGAHLVRLIKEKNLKNIVEFGASFGISTLFLAQGALATGGRIITTELVESKAIKAIKNYEKAGVNDLIEVRIGDALETLKGHEEPIDLLLLDGWKDLYLPLFQALEPNFHNDTIIYVDNADMSEVKTFLNSVSQSPQYQLQSIFGEKAVLITVK
jgi:predicted O-methyltransferase YrrM